MSNQNDSYVGHTDIAATGNDYAQIAAVIKQLQAGHAGSTIVKVVKVTPPVSGSAYGRIDVVPQVHQIDGDGNAWPHETIYDVPYARMQGGASAVIMDPVVGDLGICVFADRDISSVKNTATASPPGSRRMNHMSDAMYTGGMLNGTPTQFVDFTGNQIRIVSTTKITLQAPEIDLVSPIVKSNGTITVDTDVIAGGHVSLVHHTHDSNGSQPS